MTQANGIGVNVNGGVLFSTGQWQHVAAVADGSKVRLYHNGAEVGVAADYDGTIRVEIPSVSIGFKTGDMPVRYSSNSNGDHLRAARDERQ